MTPYYGSVTRVNPFGETVIPTYGEVVAMNPPWDWDWEAWAPGGYPYAFGGEPYPVEAEDFYAFDEEVLWAAIEDAVLDTAIDVVLVFEEMLSPPERCFPDAQYLVGWSQPPHPIDWIPSVNPKASFREQARAVLYDYFHDDELRNWVSQGDVKDAFGYGKGKPIQHIEDYDPILLIDAFENKSHPVWKGRGGNATWQAMNTAVRNAVKRRIKLGALPQSSYVTHPGPVYIYYYDHDRMKKIVYPPSDIPDAMKPDNKKWWGVGNVKVYETQDPKKIEAERKKPGDPGGGVWDGEGFDFQKDLGQVGEIFGIIMEAVGAVLQVIPGVGTAIGGALIVGGAVIQSITAAIGDAMIGADNAAALAGLAQAVIKAVGVAGMEIPPDTAKAVSGTINTIAATVSQAQKQNLSFSKTWDLVASQAQKMGRIGDEEAHILAKVLGENEAGSLFIKGHTVGKFAKPEQIEAIAEIVKGFSIFVKDPKALNLFLLGAGIGHLTAVQEGQKPPLIAKASSKRLSPEEAAKKKRMKLAGVHRTGAVITAGEAAAREDLDDLVGALGSRYEFAGQTEPPVVWEPTAWGCPKGTWWDSLEGKCRPMTPTCPIGFFWDPTIRTCRSIGSPR